MTLTKTEPIIINGIKIAGKITEVIANQVAALEKHRIIPGLAVIIVGNNPASRLYVQRKQEMAKAVGMISHVIDLDEKISTKNLINKINHLNNDPKINGILVQLPLPAHIDQIEIINSIDPYKDVDGFTIENIGKLITRQQDALIPCTPQGCMILIRSFEKTLSNKHAVVIGRSNIVGRPMSNLLINNDCTVTLVHSQTPHPQTITSQADILVSATGIRNLVKANWVKEDAIVIDVGISRYTDPDGKIKISGDVDFENVKHKTKAITPVPGGVGPMTIACLLKNTIQATCMQKSIKLGNIT
jgi:methylenetetrahydrofolate dehydrogenase (NADP+)/methenyltetrahydrofolate cyclohydrolase